jgi:hypothetical protein
MAPTTQLALTPDITMVDRTITTTTHHSAEEEALNTAPPPPYTDADDEGNDDSDSDSDPRDIWERPQKITINAAASKAEATSSAQLRSLHFPKRSFSARRCSLSFRSSTTAWARAVVGVVLILI